MGRPSKLTDAQRREIRKRLSAGETQRALAKEFGVSNGLVAGLFVGRSKTIKSLAHAIATTEKQVESLSVPEQVIVRSMADQLKSMHYDYSRGAADSLNTAAHLHRIANKKAKLVTESTDTEALRDIAVLTQTANQASSMASSLLTANKGMVDNLATDAPTLTQAERDRLVGLG